MFLTNQRCLTSKKGDLPLCFKQVQITYRTESRIENYLHSQAPPPKRKDGDAQSLINY